MRRNTRLRPRPIWLFAILLPAALLFGCAGSPSAGFDPDASTLKVFRGKTEGSTGEHPAVAVSLVLCRNGSAVYGSWNAGPAYGLLEGQVDAAGRLQVNLFAPGGVGQGGSFSGSYGKLETLLEGELQLPGSKAPELLQFSEDPAAVAGLRFLKLRDENRAFMPAKAPEPTRFVYAGFEPAAEGSFRDWFRGRFQAGFSLEQAMATERDRFFGDYRAYAEQISKDFGPDSVFPWFYEGRQFLVHRRGGLLVMGLRLASYSGGAHGSASLRYALVDEGQARLLGSADIFQDGWEERLRPLLNAAARRELGLAADASLKDAGFFVDALEPNGNCFIHEGGLGFHYDPYDVAPYSSGDFWVSLPFSELAGILRPEFLAAYGLPATAAP